MDAVVCHHHRCRCCSSLNLNFWFVSNTCFFFPSIVWISVNIVLNPNRHVKYTHAYSHTNQNIQKPTINNNNNNRWPKENNNKTNKYNKRIDTNSFLCISNSIKKIESYEQYFFNFLYCYCCCCCHGYFQLKQKKKNGQLWMSIMSKRMNLIGNSLECVHAYVRDTYDTIETESSSHMFYRGIIATQTLIIIHTIIDWLIFAAAYVFVGIIIFSECMCVFLFLYIYFTLSKTHLFIF